MSNVTPVFRADINDVCVIVACPLSPALPWLLATSYISSDCIYVEASRDFEIQRHKTFKNHIRSKKSCIQETPNLLTDADRSTGIEKVH